jgi:hypothetical protein
MPDEPTSKRVDIAQWVGTALWIILIESHVISRPLVFRFGPFIMLLSFFVIASPIAAKKWQRMCLLAAGVAVVGFLLTRFVFR